MFAFWLLHESLTLKKVLSVLAATFGVVIVIGLGSGGGSYLWGNLTLGIAAVTWALLYAS
ncbi:hypothetical protein [Numidum massiliense]|uniref:hypothetical protein n=1 Tax=Numidum massiliense TaxID=1522315 RepID=UPI0006D55F89|nr:hypothetical protein [Numidum massiliense]